MAIPIPPLSPPESTSQDSFSFFDPLTETELCQLSAIRSEKLSQRSKHIDSLSKSVQGIGSHGANDVELSALANLARKKYLIARSGEGGDAPGGFRLLPMVLTDAFSEQQCDSILQRLEAYLAAEGNSLSKDRHGAFPTTDVPITSLDRFSPNDEDKGRVEAWCRERVLERMAEEVHRGCRCDMRAEYLGFRDLFVAFYDGEEDDGGDVSGGGREKGQDFLSLHRDGCLLSFTLLLNSETEFEGGGTFFPSQSSSPGSKTDLHPPPQLLSHDSSTWIDTPESVTYFLEKGQALIHDSKLLHGARKVVKGRRIILVGFVDTVDVLRKGSRSTTGMSRTS